MKRVFCDICNSEISLEDRMMTEKNTLLDKLIGDRMDICPACRMVGMSLDAPKIILDAWKQAVTARADKHETMTA